MKTETQRRQKDDAMEIDLLEVFFELLAHWKLIFLSTIMVAAIAFAVSKFVMVPQYESKSMLYVLSKSTSITSLTDIQMGTNLTNDYLVVVAGRPVLDQVIENLGLNEDYEALSGQISIDNPSDSRILEITVTDQDPNRAKLIADEVAKVAASYISEKMDQDPPTVIQKGYADGEPISPSVGKNTAIGGILGFLLAAGIVILSYLLNDTIMTAEDVEKKLGLMMLGSLPEESQAEYDGEKKRHQKVAKKSHKKTA